jgi:hypothetical protein
MIRLALRLSVLGMVVIVVAGSALEAQPLQPQPGEEALLGGLGDKLLPKESSRLGDMRHGKKPVADPIAKEGEENKAVLLKAARYYVFRLTNPIYLEREKNPEQLTVSDLVNQFYDKILLTPEIRGKRALKDEQKQYLKEFIKELIPCVREVLSKNGKTIVRVNVVRMAAGLAEAGQEDIADTLRDVILNDKENEGVKLYAFRGLRELFEFGGPDKSAIQKPGREADCIRAVALYIARPRPGALPADAPLDEVGAYQFVRREAIRALAASRYPILRDKGGDVLTALWLQRVLLKELDPPSSLTEQVEATIGLCQLQAKLAKEYNLDYAAYEAGRLVVEFIKQYNDQRAGKQYLLPWKLYATRLNLALDVLGAQAKEPGTNKDAATYVAKVVGDAQKVLRPVEIDKDTDPAALNALDTFLQNPPPSKELLKGVKEATLKTGKPEK